MLSAIVRVLVGLLIGLAVLPFCIDLLLHVIQQRRHLPPDALALGGGLVLGAVLGFWRRPHELLHTMLHEAAHAFACLVLFVRIQRIAASAGKGGEVTHDAVDPIRTALIAIAPYTLPLILGPALLARALVVEPTPWRAGLQALVGLLFMTHLAGLGRNLSRNWQGPGADIPRVGHLTAAVLVTIALLLVLSATIVVCWRSHLPPAA